MYYKKKKKNEADFHVHSVKVVFVSGSRKITCSVFDSMVENEEDESPFLFFYQAKIIARRPRKKNKMHFSIFLSSFECKLIPYIVDDINYD